MQCAKAPRKEEKEGGLERPAWQPGEVTNMGQPAGLSTTVPPTFSDCPEIFFFLITPINLIRSAITLRRKQEEISSYHGGASATVTMDGLVVFLEK